MACEIEDLNRVFKGLNIKATCKDVKQHRHMAFFDVELQPGTKVKKLEGLTQEIALSLRSFTNPVFRTIPTQGIVQLSVAMRESTPINLSDIMEQQPPNSFLPFLIGETSVGDKLWMDMSANPHMIVSGTTGSGKSTFLHVLIYNAMMRDDLLVYVSDPKNGVEFGDYDGGAVKYVATSYSSTLEMITYIHEEMERRYQVMKKHNVSKIEDNENLFPKILLIIDEVAELMLVDQDKSNKTRGLFQKTLISLAQKARSCGVYIVLATQRPSIDVITGLIKANFPARLAFKVSSNQDSKVILDKIGAEDLLGYGDGIINNSKFSYLRFQCAYTSKQEIMSKYKGA